MALPDTTASIRYPGTTTTLFVSLYIILLAFFILLTSIGQTDRTRSSSVLESLWTTFPGGYQNPARGQRGASDAIARVEALFRQQIERLNVQLAGGGSRMALGMRRNALFRSGTQDFTAQAPDLVLKLADLMRRGSVGQDLVIGLEFSGASGGQGLGAAQAARLAAALESAGLDSARIALMLNPSIPADRLTLTLDDSALRPGVEVTR